jgi:hypothetical protein
MHAAQLEEPVPEYMPTEQGRQFDDAVDATTEEYLPVLQPIQSTEPVLAWNQPFPQMVQLVDAGAGPYFPISHEIQVCARAESAYCPVSHAVQFENAAFEKNPA